MSVDLWGVVSVELTAEVTAELTAELTVEVTPGEDSLGILPTSTSQDDCTLPEGWSVYIVEPGTTLFTISLAVNSTIGELRDVNCLVDVDYIRAGDELYVPRMPSRQVATAEPSGATTPPEGDGSNLIPLGCTDPAAYINSPMAGETVSSYIAMTGTAAIFDFSYYVLEIRPDGTPAYSFYSRTDSPVFDNVLGHLDPGAFSAGVYWIRLVVYDVNNTVPPDATCTIPIRFE